MSLQAAALYATVSVAGADKAVRDLGKVSGATDHTINKLKIMGRSSQGIGKGVGQMAGGISTIVQRTAAIVVGAGAAATVVAANFQDAFAGVKKTVEGTPQELDALNDALKRLSTRIPVSYTDLAGIAQEAGALNVASKDVDKFTEAVARTSAATVGLDTAAAAEAFGKLGTVFSLHGADYERLGSVLVELGRNGASTEADIVAVTKRFAAAGQQAGLSAAQVLGWSSALASLGPEAEAAGGALQRVFNRASRNIGLMGEKGLVGENAKSRVSVFAKVSGMSVDEFVALYTKDASAAMQGFIVGLSKMDKFEQQKALFNAGIVNQRDLLAIQSFIQRYPVLVDQLKISNKAWAENTALLSVSATRFDTLKAKGKELWNTLLVGADAFGEGVLPSLSRLADRAKAILLAHIEDFRKMGVEVGRFIDSIDWSRVENGLRTMADLAGTVLGIVKNIAATFPEASAGFLGLVGIDKLSGGMLGKGAGNIAGGAFDYFLARGSSPGNPQWVATAGGFGGLGGGAGAEALGGAGFLATLRSLAGPIAAMVALEVTGHEAAQQVNADAARKGLKTTFEMPAGFLDFPTLLSNLDQGIKLLNGTTPHTPTRIGHRETPRDDAAATKVATNLGETLGKAAVHMLTTLGKEEAIELYRQSAKIRGLDYDHLKPSTSITPRLKFLAGEHKPKDLTVVADALVTHFERSSKPLYTSAKNQERTLTQLRALQARFIARGDTKSAAAIGADIERMERKMSGGLTKVERKQRATEIATLGAKQAIRDKELSANVTVHSSVNLNGRTIATAIAAYTPTQQRHDRNV